MAFYDESVMDSDRREIRELMQSIHARSSLNIRTNEDVDRLRKYLLSDAKSILSSAEKLIGLLCREYERWRS